MDFIDLVVRNRCTRRFKQDQTLDRETLLELVNLARQTASGSNLQPLKYYLSWQPNQNEKIFPLVKWAGYLPDWQGPQEGERPAAYIVILGDLSISASFAKDTGIAAQTILLGAVERGYNGCMLGSFKDEKVREVLGLPDSLQTQLIVALGVSAEQAVLEEVGTDGSIRYWRDGNDVLHVPKRPLGAIVLT
ncbi:MAG: nitroreductase family protein [Anaerolineales bacterium]|nr:nitroreductase family protein [Anaerolineales bacterium]